MRAQKPRGTTSSLLLPVGDERPERQHDDEDCALRADLPVGRDLEEDEEGTGQRQRQGAHHGAQRRDPAADEFATAKDDAGDRVERVAVGHMGIARGRQAEQRETGEARRRSRPACTSRSWSSASTNLRALSALGLPPAPRAMTP